MFLEYKPNDRGTLDWFGTQVEELNNKFKDKNIFLKKKITINLRGLHSVVGVPMKPSGHVQMALCLDTLQ